MTQRVVVAAAALAVLAPALSHPLAHTQRPTFRSAARLVQVSVIVQDREGRPVRGLAAEDFEVIENRKRQSVAHFAVQEEDAVPGTPGTLPVGTFSNVLDGRVGSGATILFFDRLNTHDTDQIYARKHVIDFIQQLQPDDRIGFYVMDSTALRVIQDFTSQASALIALLEGIARTSSQELIASEDRLPRVQGGDGLDAMFEAMITKSELAMNAFYMQARADMTVEALELLANRLAGVRGRKSVIWVSSAFPLYFNDGIAMQQMSPRVYRATRALSHADISIYPVDARGLIGTVSGVPGRSSFTTMAKLAPSFDTSSLIAEQTGGKVFRNTNDLRGAMTRATEDAALTYVLGYYPQDERFDGRFRRIDVKVKRPGVSVRHRSGYFAHPPPSAAGLEEDGLITAMQYPVEATGVGMTVTPAASAAEDGDVTLTVRVDPSSLSLQRQDGQSKGQLEFAIGQRLPDRRMQNSVHLTVPLDIPDAMLDELGKSGLTLSRTVTVATTAQTVVVGVRDLTSGAIGTVRLDAARVRASARR